MRQQQSLIQIVGAKTLSHEQHLKTDAHSSKRFCRTRESIPDTLLESAFCLTGTARMSLPTLLDQRVHGEAAVLIARGADRDAGGNLILTLDGLALRRR